MNKTSLQQDTGCYGLGLRPYDTGKLHQSRQLNLGWLMQLYHPYPDKERLVDDSQSKPMGNFDKLAGAENRRRQIITGASRAAIRRSGEPALLAFKTTRKR